MEFVLKHIGQFVIITMYIYIYIKYIKYIKYIEYIYICMYMYVYIKYIHGIQGF